MSETEADLKRLAKKLGGGWRIEHGVMPVVVLTIVEAQRLEKRLDDRLEPFTNEELRAIASAFDVSDSESMVDRSDESPAVALWRSVWDELAARGVGTGLIGDERP